MSNSMNVVDLSTVVRHGKFRTPRNKNLDRPRAVREQVLTTCVSLGAGESGNNGKGMQFSAKRECDLWGRK
jgi:hypothetical protein